jgi:hypothetical protein
MTRIDIWRQNKKIQALINESTLSLLFHTKDNKKDQPNLTRAE